MLKIVFLFHEIVFRIGMQRQLWFMMRADRSADIRVDRSQYKIFAQELQDVGIVCYNYRRENSIAVYGRNFSKRQHNDEWTAERRGLLCWKTQRSGWLRMLSAV